MRPLGDDLLNSSFQDLKKQITLTKKYLQLKLLHDNVSLRGDFKIRQDLYDLIRRSIRSGKSESALLIGPSWCGKSTLINSILHQLSEESDEASDAVFIKLNGNIHNNDKDTLKSLTEQIKLDDEVSSKAFTSTVDYLTYLFNALRLGKSKSLVFILDNFHLFCMNNRPQTLLYELFDTIYFDRAPICLVGITSVLNVKSSLEKRIRSRTSDNVYYMMSYDGLNGRTPLEGCTDSLVDLLSLPDLNGKKSSEDANFTVPKAILRKVNYKAKTFRDLHPSFVEKWNKVVKEFVCDERVLNSLDKLCYFRSETVVIIKNVLFQTIYNISEGKPFIDISDFVTAIDQHVSTTDNIRKLQSLSLLELSMLIAMKHGIDIYDGQPMNFVMVVERYKKFLNSTSSIRSLSHSLLMSAFKHLQDEELISPVGPSQSSGSSLYSRGPIEYQMYTISVANEEIQEAVTTSATLPTEIKHWFDNPVL